MRIVSISDSHCRLRNVKIPDGDILIHSGDLTFVGNIPEISQELAEMKRLKTRFKHIIYSPGNHDWMGERNPSLLREMCNEAGVTLLIDEAIVIDGIKIYGSPWQPEFCNWAFNLPRGQALREKWDLIPADTDILVTHGPPYGILDPVERFNGQKCEFEIEYVGCEELYKKVMSMPNLKIHQFGHIHAGYGIFKVGNTSFINASTCTEQYRPINQPIVTDL